MPPLTTRPQTAFLRLLCLLVLPLLACSASPFGGSPEPGPIAPAAVAPAATIVAATAAAALVDPAVSSTPLIFTQALAEDIEKLNPVLTADAASHALQGLFLPRLIERDAQTGEPQATGLATGWEWSNDGATLTVTLRNDVSWSDGAPVTGRDVGFTYAALASPTVKSPLRALVDNLGAITPMDDGSLVFSLHQPDCTFLQTLTLPILPSHLFAADLSDITTNGWNDAPAVGAGPFLFAKRTPGVSMTLVRNPAWFKGAPVIAEFNLRVIPDAADRLRALITGAVDLAANLPAEAGEISGGVRMTDFLSDGYSMLAINSADPAAPQPGRSESGAILPQTPHPILGDLRVRQAIAQGIDTTRLLREIYGAGAAPLTSWVLPTAPWAFAADLPTYRFDPEAARALLDEAGWNLVAGSNTRTRNGARLALAIVTNDDNPERMRLAGGMRDALNALGFEATVSALPFAQAADLILQQRFDLALLGWENAGPDPALGAYFDSRNDLPGSGVNVTSFQKPIVDTLFDAARTAPGCDPAVRGDLYRQIQRQVFDEATMLPLNGLRNQVGIAAGWRNIQPGPWALDAGVEGWVKQE